jgi:hypothetical protein
MCHTVCGLCSVSIAVRAPGEVSCRAAAGQCLTGVRRPQLPASPCMPAIYKSTILPGMCPLVRLCEKVMLRWPIIPVALPGSAAAVPRTPPPLPPLPPLPPPPDGWRLLHLPPCTCIQCVSSACQWSPSRANKSSSGACFLSEGPFCSTTVSDPHFHNVEAIDPCAV